jgi:4-amino-4-deoxy-L-arabinose transferase-like glycosyltransferase
MRPRRSPLQQTIVDKKPRQSRRRAPAGAEETGPLPKAQPFCQIEEILQGFSTERRVFALFCIAFIEYVLLINNSWNASPDSALYISLGRSLAAGKGYVFNGELHTYVPPGFPFLTCLATKIFGPGFFGLRLMMALTGFLNVLASYLLFRRVAGKNTALLLGTVVALNYALINNSCLVLADVPFALFSTIACLSLFKAAGKEPKILWAVITGAALSVLPLIRINGMGFGPAAAVFLFFSWKEAGLVKRLLFVGLVLAIAYLPIGAWTVWKASFPSSASEGSYYNAVAGRHWSDQLHIVLTAFISYFPETTLAFTGLNLKTGVLEFILPLVAAVGAVVLFRKGERLFVPLAFIQYSGLLLSTAGERYLLFLLPALYLFLAQATLSGVQLLEEKRRLLINPRRALIYLFAFLTLTNWAHSLVPIFHARTALEKGGPETERSLPYFRAAYWLKTSAPTAKVLTTHARVIHLLSGCPTVTLVRSGVPEQDTWVDDRTGIKKELEKTRPKFLFTDEKNAALYDQVKAAVHELGMDLKEIPEASSPPRFKLFEMVGGEKAP